MYFKLKIGETVKQNYHLKNLDGTSKKFLLKNLNNELAMLIYECFAAVCQLILLDTWIDIIWIIYLKLMRIIKLDRRFEKKIYQKIIGFVNDIDHDKGRLKYFHH